VMENIYWSFGVNTLANLIFEVPNKFVVK